MKKQYALGFDMVRFGKRIEPSAENHEIYKEYFAQYRKVYRTSGDRMCETTGLNS